MTGKVARMFGASLPRFLRRPSRAGPDGSFELVRQTTTLHNISRVEKHLPEILGRALARGWIDPAFSTAFLNNPVGMLHRYDVHLPSTVSIEVEMTETARQRVVVYDTPRAGVKRRVMYLQLVMMAGK